jgi:hypothetical protein
MIGTLPWSSSLLGQSSRRASVADSLEVTANVYRRLFDGLTLQTSQRAAAEDAIRKAFVRQQAQFPIETEAHWRTIVNIQAQRDSFLVGLVSDANEKKKLLERLLADQPRSSRWKI